MFLKFRPKAQHKSVKESLKKQGELRKRLEKAWDNKLEEDLYEKNVVHVSSWYPYGDYEIEGNESEIKLRLHVFSEDGLDVELEWLIEAERGVQLKRSFSVDNDHLMESDYFYPKEWMLREELDEEWFDLFRRMRKVLLQKKVELHLIYEDYEQVEHYKRLM